MLIQFKQVKKKTRVVSDKMGKCFNCGCPVSKNTPLTWKNWRNYRSVYGCESCYTQTNNGAVIRSNEAYICPSCREKVHYDWCFFDTRIGQFVCEDCHEAGIRNEG